MTTFQTSLYSPQSTNVLFWKCNSVLGCNPDQEPLNNTHCSQGENAAAAAATAKSLQSCLTLCNPIDSSPPGSPIPGIRQARTLEWVAISFSNAGNWKVKVKSLSHVRLFATPWTAAHQAPPSMGFSRQEYRSGVPSPSPLPSEPPAKLHMRPRICSNHLQCFWLFA